MYNNFQYLPPAEGSMNMALPTFHNMQYLSGSASSTASTMLTSSSVSNYLLQNPRMRYYLSKLFDIEDDLEFCPDIPEMQTSPTIRKFNPYTAALFSPTNFEVPHLPRPSTPRKKDARKVALPAK